MVPTPKPNPAEQRNGGLLRAQMSSGHNAGFICLFPSTRGDELERLSLNGRWKNFPKWVLGRCGPEQIRDELKAGNYPTGVQVP